MILWKTVNPVKSGDSIPVFMSMNLSEISSDLGNLSHISRRSSGNQALFFPLTSYAKMTEVTQVLIDGKTIFVKEGAKAKTDLKNAGVMVGNKLAVTSVRKLYDVLINQLNDEGFNDFWDAIKSGQPCYDIFKKIIGEDLAESTIDWRLRNAIKAGYAGVRNLTQKGSYAKQIPS